MVSGVCGLRGRRVLANMDETPGHVCVGSTGSRVVDDVVRLPVGLRQRCRMFGDRLELGGTRVPEVLAPRTVECRVRHGPHAWSRPL